jgi:hypothetical protein
MVTISSHAHKGHLKCLQQTEHETDWNQLPVHPAAPWLGSAIMAACRWLKGRTPCTDGSSGGQGGSFAAVGSGTCKDGE